VVYGKDDRQDYYGVTEPSKRLLFEAYSAALISDYRIPSLLDGTLAGIQTLQEVEQLCPDEEFAEQPSAAFCSAVLVAQGLILTSRHCLAATELNHMRLVFGYYLESRERLALTAQDVYELTSIVAVSDEGVDGIDYAWLRFANATAKERIPAPVISSLSRVVETQPLIALNAGSGIPLKLDAGGSVIDARQDSQDYFLADIDAFRGASGSGVFSADGTLLGIVVSGNADFVRSENGCRKAVRLLNEEGKEKITYARRAISGLCSVEPDHALCAVDCDPPCHDHSTADDGTLASCALHQSTHRTAHQAWSTVGVGLLVGLAIHRRRTRRARTLS